MKLRLIALAIITAVLVVGCAGSPFQISRMDGDQLSSVSDDQLIRALGNEVYRNEAMFEEARERGLVTRDEIRLIKAKQIRIGMSESALIASWGQPPRINRSVGSYGVHKQFVYRGSSTYLSRTYVYVGNGKVRGWQD